MLSALKTAFTHQLSKQLARPHGRLRSHFVLKKLNQLNPRIIRETLKHVAFDENERVLDVGFGGGISFDMLLTHHNAEGLNLHLHGLEISDEAIRYVSKTFAKHIRTQRLTLHKADAQHTPFDDGFFNHIFSVNTVYFFKDPKPLLRELSRILANKGTLVLAIREPQTLKRFAFTQSNFHFHETSDLLDHLVALGLQTTVVDHSDTLPFKCLIAQKN